MHCQSLEVNQNESQKQRVGSKGQTPHLLEKSRNRAIHCRCTKRISQIKGREKMSLGQAGAAVSLFCIIIGIVAFFMPGGWWLLSILMFSIVLVIWITGFMWRNAVAADNLISKYQDEDLGDEDEK